MTVAILLIAVPLAFTAVYTVLGVTFSYPAILRHDSADVLARFAAGGTRLVLLWWAFALTALAFIPIAVGVSDWIGPGVLASASLVLGVLAALVQALGLIRWPLLVPLLAREREANPQTVDLLFAVVNRYLGVAVGEHLGYLLTGSWTITVAVAILPTAPWWFTLAGVLVGASLLFGALEFLGPFEQAGWGLAGTVVAIGYTAWAAWLITGGVLLLLA